MSEEQTNPQGETIEESSATQTQAETNEPQTETKPQEQTDYSNITEVEDATKALKEKGFDYDVLQTEWNETGKLSDETRAKLNAQGISNDIIDTYIEGRQAIADKAWDDIASVVGGREEMNTIVDWAIQNLSEKEKQSIDAVKDPNIIKIILQNLKVRMNDKEGFLPQQITGNSGEITGNYFRSMAEVEEAINNPRYAKDEVYRNEVALKITASREAGVLELK